MKLIAVGMAIGLLFTACSGGGDKKEVSKPKVTTTSVLPPECKAERASLEGNAKAGGTEGVPISEACSNAVFLSSIKASGSDELQKLSKDQKLAFGHGMCAYSAALKNTPDSAPSYKELIDSTAKSWGTSKDVVEEVIGLANQLCPGQMATVTALKEDVGKVTVGLNAAGQGTLKVTYTGPDGNELQDDVDAPWEHEVDFETPADMTFVVSSPDETVSCSVVVNGEEVVKAEAEKGKDADCSATAGKIREAAR